MKWIDPLSDPAVTFAAYIWQVGKAETWGRLDRAIKAEELSNPIPLVEFAEYLQAVLQPPLPPSGRVVPVETPPPPKPQPQTPAASETAIPKKKTENIFNNIAWQPILIVGCILAFVIGQLTTPSSPAVPPTSTPNVVALTSKAGQATAQAILTERACYQDTLQGLPPEYSRCSDELSEEEKEDQSYLWEYRETQSAPCTIKGNISLDGEKIYHLPGQEFYAATIIDPTYGERWFCTEAEARAAGWRKSNR